jgi:disulfide bond formation protein DsbB
MAIVQPGESGTRAVTGEVMVRLNVVALYAVSAVLVAAYVIEFTRDELPCPLCLLQRIALCGMAAGIVLNLRFGLRPRNYGLILLAASMGGVFAVRQILLHIAPGDPGYGSTIFGYHYYTWCAIVFAVAIVATAFVLLFDDQFERMAPRRLGAFAVVAVALAFGVTLANVATTFLECGFHVCPDNPVTFELLGWPS